MIAATFSCPRTSKSRRRGRPLGDTALAIRSTVLDLTDRFERMTVRQVFYGLEVQGVVDKTEGGYRQVQKQVLAMRREDLLPWSFITDGTRWQRKPKSYVGVHDYMAHMARTYRRNLWQAQDVRLEIWLEKDALADTIVDATAKWDVPLMVSRGQSSATFLWNAAQAALWDLPTRPPKEKDPEAKKFTGPAVELDAIPPDMLVGLVEDAIVSHVDPQAWAVEQAVEEEERRGLLRLAGATA
jgi:hypothetical protein